MTSDWPPDFHNKFYSEITPVQRGGFGLKWWDKTVDCLWNWKAIRPFCKERIRSRGAPRLKQLSSHFRILMKETAAGSANFENATWDMVRRLFEIAMEIKGVESPVFASKLCHFCAPGYYLVYDKAFLGGRGLYEPYWEACRREWAACEQKEALRALLKAKIGPQVSDSYPYATKIVELCIAGRRAEAR